MRKKHLLLLGLGVGIGAGARPLADVVAAATMDENLPIDDAGQYRLAIHEGAHALVDQMRLSKYPLKRIWIATTTSMVRPLGQVEAEEMPQQLGTLDERFNRVVELMAGMAAEAIVFGNVTDVVGLDLDKASEASSQLVAVPNGSGVQKTVQECMIAAYHHASALVRTNQGTLKELAGLLLAQPPKRGIRSLDAEQIRKFFEGRKLDDGRTILGPNPPSCP